MLYCPSQKKRLKLPKNCGRRLRNKKKARAVPGHYHIGSICCGLGRANMVSPKATNKQVSIPEWLEYCIMLLGIVNRSQRRGQLFPFWKLFGISERLESEEEMKEYNQQRRWLGAASPWEGSPPPKDGTYILGLWYGIPVVARWADYGDGYKGWVFDNDGELAMIGEPKLWAFILDRDGNPILLGEE